MSARLLKGIILLGLGLSTAVNATQVTFRGEKYTAYIGDIDGNSYSDIYLRAADKFVLIHGNISVPLLLRPATPSYLISSVKDSSGVHYNAPTVVTTENFNYRSMAEFNGSYVFIDKNSDGQLDLQLEGSSQLLYVLAINGNTQASATIVYERRPKIFDFTTIPDTIENWDMKRCTDPTKPTASPSCDNTYKRALIY